MVDAHQPVNSDDMQGITLHSYQDDLDTHGTDRVMDEFGDDPTKILGVNPAGFKEELSRLDSDDQEGESDDMREEVEDMDEDFDRGEN